MRDIPVHAEIELIHPAERCGRAQHWTEMPQCSRTGVAPEIYAQHSAENSPDGTGEAVAAGSGGRAARIMGH
jgi:hypothetical protein